MLFSLSLQRETSCPAGVAFATAWGEAAHGVLCSDKKGFQLGAAKSYAWGQGQLNVLA